MAHIRTFLTRQDLTKAAVTLFIHLAKEAINERGEFIVALSGGSTPQPLYTALGSPEIRVKLVWNKIHLCWGDERHVPMNHPDSNFHLVKEELLNKIIIPEENIHRVPVELGHSMAALAYEENLRGIFKGVWPRFDMVLLGMGEDGHTASLFPNSSGLQEEERWFIDNFSAEKNAWRLTLTKNAINTARNIIVLVSGSEKSEMLADVLNGPRDPISKPIQFISPLHGEMFWMVDRDAASQL